VPRLLAIALVAVVGYVALADPARDSDQPERAVAFIRTVGKLRAEFVGNVRPAIEREEVEIATGSGFFVNPDGLLLTSQHVVAGREERGRLQGAEATLTLEVQRVEVGLHTTDGPQWLTASVLAADAERDLALLSVTAGGLPYLPLGDSDAAAAGEPTTALGYPLGRAVEVAQRDTPAIVPRLSVSPGSLSARRDDASGAARYLQTDATLNPGSSGGPMLDADGYVLGVVEMKLSGGAGLGFALPVNAVKDFLEETGFLAMLPSRRLRSGPLQSLPGKGLRLQLPDAYRDEGRGRLRVDGVFEEGAPRLLVERVASPWALEQIEETLASGAALGGPGLSAPAQRRLERSSPRRLAGSLRGRAEDGRPLWMEYALLDLGREKIVARWLGPPDAVAFNLSVLRGSLDSLEADPLLTEEVAAVIDPPLAAAASRIPGVPPARLPSGFRIAEGAESPCGALPPPDASMTASPSGDFTIEMRWSFWRQAPRDPVEAATACHPEAASSDRWSARRSRLGVDLVAHGAFVAVGPGLLAVEIEFPVAKQRFVEGLARRWMTAAVAEPGGE